MIAPSNITPIATASYMCFLFNFSYCFLLEYSFARGCWIKTCGKVEEITVPSSGLGQYGFSANRGDII
jgi:hypothetical protein